MIFNRVAVVGMLVGALWTLFPQGSGAQTAERFYQKAFEFSQEGRNLAAADAYREALDLKSDWAEAHHGLAVMHFRTGNGPETVAHFRRALDLYREREDAWARDNVPIVERNLELAYKHFALDPGDFSQMETVSGPKPGAAWRRTGFGFLIGPHGYLLAPNHTIEHGKQIRVRFRDQATTAVRIVKQFIIYNIALLHIEDSAFSGKPGLSLGNGTALLSGGDVFSLDAPELKDLSVRG